MPLNVRRFFCSVSLILSCSILIAAQTSGDVMRERVAKAKAFIAVRNYSAAIYELENIRRETSDPTVNGVINVLLVNSFLEQGDYKRAQDFLTELSKSTKPGASANYFAAAGQVVKGARNQIERYRSLGLNVADPTLPKDAVADVDKMRETLEKVVEQTKLLSKDKAQTSNAMALMEEATNARGGLARDNFDANRWKNEVADAREDLANSRSVITNAVNEMPPTQPVVTSTPSINTVAANTTQPNSTPIQTAIIKPVSLSDENSNSAANKTEKIIIEVPKEETKETSDNQTTASNYSPKTTAPAIRDKMTGKGNNENVADKTDKKTETPAVTTSTENPKNSSPVEVGSLVNYATQKSNPVYPIVAKNMRMTGVVKVELTVDENGQVSEVQNASGPPMLQRAASEAVKKWRFKPFTRDGQAIKATGFVNFNFSL